MEFNEVIERRRTVRSFAEKGVPEEKIIKALDAGIKAPTYNHLREWDFILVKDMYVRMDIVKAEGIPDSFNMPELEKNFSDSDSLLKEMYLDAIPKQKSMLLKTPELLVVVFKPKTKVEESKKIYDLNCLASVWCCIENILLALASENLFGVTYIPQKTDQVKKVLGVPDQLEVAAIIPFGYKEDETKTVNQKQVDLKQKIHFNRW
jgi:nitroreductase